MATELVLLAALVCTLVAHLSHQFTRPLSKLYILDRPNARSMHTVPTPRTGGVAILVGIIFGTGLLLALGFEIHSQLAWITIAVALVAAVGFWDDRRSIPPLPRIAAQGTAAAIIVFAGLSLEEIPSPGTTITLNPILGGILTWLFIVWMTNLYNFMDGMDGLAGSMGVIGFGTFAVFGYIANDSTFMAANIIVACAALGFLALNLPRARIFMGDAGAYALGLLAAVLALWGISSGVFGLLSALLVFAPFILDATVTLAIRTLTHKPVWRAHREHAYQQLVKAGVQPTRVLTVECGLMAACGVMSLASNRQSPGVQLVMLGVVTATFGALAFYALLRAKSVASELDSVQS
jgi:UDP-N-acetylmuramyl pentapeptide phosphotransferase/UDP-N-acetylglucosamine-1-phosphate transferase